MMILEISTLIGCAINCGFCPQTKIEAAYHGPRLMTLDLFKRCLINSPTQCPVSFAGFAEPFLNNATADMLEHANDGREIIIYTTGVGIGRNDIDVLQKVKPSVVTLHLADVEGIAKIKCDAAYVATVTEIADTLPDVRWMTMGTLPEALVPRFGRLTALPMQSRAGNVDGFVKIGKSGPLKCGPAPELDHPVLLPSGDLAVCCQDYGLEHIVGNLAEQTWDEIQRGPGMAKIKAKMQSGPCLCRQCEYAQCA